MKEKWRTIRNACTSSLPCETVQHEWEIEDIEDHLTQLPRDEKLASKTFDIKTYGVEWNVHLYPNGTGRSKRDEIPVFLNASKLPKGKSYVTRFSLRCSIRPSPSSTESELLAERHYKYTYQHTDGISRYGTENFTHKSSIMERLRMGGGCLIVKCELTIYAPTMSPPAQFSASEGNAKIGYKRKAGRYLGQKPFWSTNLIWTITDIIKVLRLEKRVSSCQLSADGISQWQLTAEVNEQNKLCIGAQLLGVDDFEEKIKAHLVVVGKALNSARQLINKRTSFNLDENQYHTIHQIPAGKLTSKEYIDDLKVYCELTHDDTTQGLITSQDRTPNLYVCIEDLDKVRVYHKSRELMSHSSGFLHRQLQRIQTEENSPDNPYEIQMSRKDFELIMDFLEGDTGAFRAWRASDILAYAHKYAISDLKFYAERMLCQSLTSSNMMEVLDLAIEHGADHLEEACIYEIADYYDKIDLLPMWRRFRADNEVHAKEAMRLTNQRKCLHDLMFYLAR